MKTNITASYSYYSNKLSFNKIIILPFIPFYDMSITFDKENEYDIIFKNNDYIHTTIDYSIEDEQFNIYINHVWKHPVSDETIDGVLEKFATWERLDSTNIDELKIIMNRL